MEKEDKETKGMKITKINPPPNTQSFGKVLAKPGARQLKKAWGTCRWGRELAALWKAGMPGSKDARGAASSSQASRPALFLWFGFSFYIATPASSAVASKQVGSLSQAAAAWKLLTTLRQEFARRENTKAREAWEAAGPPSPLLPGFINLLQSKKIQRKADLDPGFFTGFSVQLNYRLALGRSERKNT